ncbi:MAG: hypothetical protein HZB36_06160, partial [Candidatus Omnitrophica bacterium]|nr:hypothetical protein [Candidatus Omnitrophota bacterium]
MSRLHDFYIAPSVSSPIDNRLTSSPVGRLVNSYGLPTVDIFSVINGFDNKRRAGKIETSAVFSNPKAMGGWRQIDERLSEGQGFAGGDKKPYLFHDAFLDWNREFFEVAFTRGSKFNLQHHGDDQDVSLRITFSRGTTPRASASLMPLSNLPKNLGLSGKFPSIESMSQPKSLLRDAYSPGVVTSSSFSSNWQSNSHNETVSNTKYFGVPVFESTMTPPLTPDDVKFFGIGATSFKGIILTDGLVTDNFISSPFGIVGKTLPQKINIVKPAESPVLKDNPLDTSISSPVSKDIKTYLATGVVVAALAAGYLNYVIKGNDEHKRADTLMASTNPADRLKARVARSLSGYVTLDRMDKVLNQMESIGPAIIREAKRFGITQERLYATIAVEQLHNEDIRDIAKAIVGSVLPNNYSQGIARIKPATAWLALKALERKDPVKLPMEYRSIAQLPKNESLKVISQRLRNDVGFSVFMAAAIVSKDGDLAYNLGSANAKILKNKMEIVDTEVNKLLLEKNPELVRKRFYELEQKYKDNDLLQDAIYRMYSISLLENFRTKTQDLSLPPATKSGSSPITTNIEPLNVSSPVALTLSGKIGGLRGTIDAKLNAVWESKKNKIKEDVPVEQFEQIKDTVKGNVLMGSLNYGRWFDQSALDLDEAIRNTPREIVRSADALAGYNGHNVPTKEQILTQVRLKELQILSSTIDIKLTPDKRDWFDAEKLLVGELSKSFQAGTLTTPGAQIILDNWEAFVDLPAELIYQQRISKNAFDALEPYDFTKLPDPITISSPIATMSTFSDAGSEKSSSPAKLNINRINALEVEGALVRSLEDIGYLRQFKATKPAILEGIKNSIAAEPIKNFRQFAGLLPEKLTPGQEAALKHAFDFGIVAGRGIISPVFGKGEIVKTDGNFVTVKFDNESKPIVFEENALWKHAQSVNSLLEDKQPQVIVHAADLARNIDFYLEEKGDDAVKLAISHVRDIETLAGKSELLAISLLQLPEFKALNIEKIDDSRASLEAIRDWAKATAAADMPALENALTSLKTPDGFKPYLDLAKLSVVSSPINNELKTGVPLGVVLASNETHFTSKTNQSFVIRPIAFGDEVREFYDSLLQQGAAPFGWMDIYEEYSNARLYEYAAGTEALYGVFKINQNRTDGGIAGMGYSRISGNALEIKNFEISPSYEREGVGTKLFGRLAIDAFSPTNSRVTQGRVSFYSPASSYTFYTDHLGLEPKEILQDPKLALFKLGAEDTLSLLERTSYFERRPLDPIGSSPVEKLSAAGALVFNNFAKDVLAPRVEKIKSIYEKSLLPLESAVGVLKTQPMGILRVQLVKGLAQLRGEIRALEAHIQKLPEGAHKLTYQHALLGTASADNAASLATTLISAKMFTAGLALTQDAQKISDGIKNIGVTVEKLENFKTAFAAIKQGAALIPIDAKIDKRSVPDLNSVSLASPVSVGQIASNLASVLKQVLTTPSIGSDRGRRTLWSGYDETLTKALGFERSQEPVLQNAIMAGSLPELSEFRSAVENMKSQPFKILLSLNNYLARVNDLEVSRKQGGNETRRQTIAGQVERLRTVLALEAFDQRLESVVKGAIDSNKINDRNQIEIPVAGLATMASHAPYYIGVDKKYGTLPTLKTQQLVRQVVNNTVEKLNQKGYSIGTNGRTILLEVQPMEEIASSPISSSFVQPAMSTSLPKLDARLVRLSDITSALYNSGYAAGLEANLRPSAITGAAQVIKFHLANSLNDIGGINKTLVNADLLPLQTQHIERLSNTIGKFATLSLPPPSTAPKVIALVTLPNNTALTSGGVGGFGTGATIIGMPGAGGIGGAGVGGFGSSSFTRPTMPDIKPLPSLDDARRFGDALKQSIDYIVESPIEAAQEQHEKTPRTEIPLTTTPIPISSAAAANTAAANTPASPNNPIIGQITLGQAASPITNDLFIDITDYALSTGELLALASSPMGGATARSPGVSSPLNELPLIKSAFRPWDSTATHVYIYNLVSSSKFSQFKNLGSVTGNLEISGNAGSRGVSSENLVSARSEFIEKTATVVNALKDTVKPVAALPKAASPVLSLGPWVKSIGKDLRQVLADRVSYVSRFNESATSAKLLEAEMAGNTGALRVTLKGFVSEIQAVPVRTTATPKTSEGILTRNSIILAGNEIISSPLGRGFFASSQIENSVVSYNFIVSSPIIERVQELKGKMASEIARAYKGDKCAVVRQRIEHTLTLAEKLYKGKSFESGQTYLEHVLDNGVTLMRWEAGWGTVLAGLLHKINKEEISQLYEGQLIPQYLVSKADAKNIHSMIAKLNKVNSSWPYFGGDIRFIEGQGSLQNYMEGLMQASGNYNGVDVSEMFMLYVADRLHSLSTKKAQDREKGYREIEHVLAPLAGFVLNFTIFEELRNKGLELYNEELYKTINYLRKDVWGFTYTEMRGLLGWLKDDLAGRLIQAGTKISITHRVKSSYSLGDKSLSTRRQEYSSFGSAEWFKEIPKQEVLKQALEKLPDVIGIRIITENVKETEAIVTQWLQQMKQLGDVSSYSVGEEPRKKDLLPEKKGYNATHLCFRLSLHEDPTKTMLPVEVMIMDKSNYMKYLTGISDNLGNPQPEAHAAYKLAMIRKLTGAQGIFLHEQVFMPYKIDWTTDWKTNLRRIQASLADNTYVAYLHQDVASYIELPKGAYPVDAAAELDLLGPKYTGFSKLEFVKEGEKPIKIIDRELLVESQPLRSLTVLVADSTEPLAQEEYMGIPAATIRAKLFLKDLTGKSLKPIAEGVATKLALPSQLGDIKEVYNTAELYAKQVGLKDGEEVLAAVGHGFINQEAFVKEHKNLRERKIVVKAEDKIGVLHEITGVLEKAGANVETVSGLEAKLPEAGLRNLTLGVEFRSPSKDKELGDKLRAIEGVRNVNIFKLERSSSPVSSSPVLYHFAEDNRIVRVEDFYGLRELEQAAKSLKKAKESGKLAKRYFRDIERLLAKNLNGEFQEGRLAAWKTEAYGSIGGIRLVEVMSMGELEEIGLPKSISGQGLARGIVALQRDLQSEGIGTALIKKSLEYLRDKKIRYYLASISSDNVKSFGAIVSAANKMDTDVDILVVGLHEVEPGIKVHTFLVDLLPVSSPIVSSPVRNNHRNRKSLFDAAGKLNGVIDYLRVVSSSETTRLSNVFRSFLMMRRSSSILESLPLILVSSNFVPSPTILRNVISSVFLATIPIVESNLSSKLFSFSPKILKSLLSSSKNEPASVAVNPDLSVFLASFFIGRSISFAMLPVKDKLTVKLSSSPIQKLSIEVVEPSRYNWLATETNQLANLYEKLAVDQDDKVERVRYERTAAMFNIAHEVLANEQASIQKAWVVRAMPSDIKGIHILQHNLIGEDMSIIPKGVVVVSPDIQRYGFGKQLFTKSLDYLNSIGSRYYLGSIDVKNEASLRMVLSAAKEMNARVMYVHTVRAEIPVDTFIVDLKPSDVLASGQKYLSTEFSKAVKELKELRAMNTVSSPIVSSPVVEKNFRNSSPILSKFISEGRLTAKGSFAFGAGYLAAAVGATALLTTTLPALAVGGGALTLVGVSYKFFQQALLIKQGGIRGPDFKVFKNNLIFLKHSFITLPVTVGILYATTNLEVVLPKSLQTIINAYPTLKMLVPGAGAIAALAYGANNGRAFFNKGVPTLIFGKVSNLLGSKIAEKINRLPLISKFTKIEGISREKNLATNDLYHQQVKAKAQEKAQAKASLSFSERMIDGIKNYKKYTLFTVPLGTLIGASFPYLKSGMALKEIAPSLFSVSTLTGFAVGIALPLLVKVTYEFFIRLTQDNIDCDRFFEEYKNSAEVEALAQRYKDEFKHAGKIDRLSYVIRNGFLRLNRAFPLTMGLVKFGLVRGQLTYWGSVVGHAVLPILFSGFGLIEPLTAVKIASWSPLTALGLAKVAALFTEYGLSHTLQELGRIGFIVLGLKMQALPRLVSALRDIKIRHTTKGAIESLNPVVLWDKRENIHKGELSRIVSLGIVRSITNPGLVRMLKDHVAQNSPESAAKATFKNREVAGLKYYVAPTVVATLFTLTTLFATAAYPFVYRTLPAIQKNNPYAALWLSSGREFAVSFWHMWIISAEIGAVIKSGHVMAEHPIFKDLGGKALNTLAQNLEGKYGAIAWGQHLLNTVNSTLGFDLSQLTHDVIGGKHDLEAWNNLVMGASAWAQMKNHQEQLAEVSGEGTIEGKVKQFMRGHNRFPEFKEFVSLANPYVEDIDNFLNSNQQNLTKQQKETLEALQVMPSKDNAKKWEKMKPLFGGDILKNALGTGVKVSNVEITTKTDIAGVAKQAGKTGVGIVVPHVVMGDETSIIVGTQDGAMYLDENGSKKTFDYTTTEFTSYRNKKLPASAKPLVVVITLDKKGVIGQEFKKAWGILTPYAASQGVDMKNVILPKGVDLTSWFNYNEIKVSVEDNRDLLEKKGLSNTVIDTVLSKDSMEWKNIPSADQKILVELNKHWANTMLPKALAASKNITPEGQKAIVELVKNAPLAKVSIKDLNSMVQTLSMQDLQKEETVTPEKAMEILKNNSYPDSLKDIFAPENKANRKALEAVLKSIIGITAPINQENVGKLMEDKHAKDFNGYVKMIREDAAKAMAIDQAIKAKNAGLTDKTPKDAMAVIKRDIEKLKHEKEQYQFKNDSWAKEVTRQTPAFNLIEWAKGFWPSIKAERAQAETYRQQVRDMTTLQSVLNTMNKYNMSLAEITDPEVKKFAAKYTEAQYPIAQVKLQDVTATVGYDKAKDIKVNIANIPAVISYYSLAQQKLTADDESEIPALELKQKQAVLNRYKEILKEAPAVDVKLSVSVRNELAGIEIAQQEITKQKLQAGKDVAPKLPNLPGFEQMQEKPKTEKENKKALVAKEKEISALKAVEKANIPAVNVLIESHVKGLDKDKDAARIERFNVMTTRLAGLGDVLAGDVKKVETMKKLADAALVNNAGREKYLASIDYLTQSWTAAVDMKNLAKEDAKIKKDVNLQDKALEHKRISLEIQKALIGVRDYNAASIAIAANGLAQEAQLLKALNAKLQPLTNELKDINTTLSNHKKIVTNYTAAVDNILKGDFSAARKSFTEALKTKYTAKEILPQESQVLAQMLKDIIVERYETKAAFPAPGTSAVIRSIDNAIAGMTKAYVRSASLNELLLLEDSRVTPQTAGIIGLLQLRNVHDIYGNLIPEDAAGLEKGRNAFQDKTFMDYIKAHNGIEQAYAPKADTQMGKDYRDFMAAYENKKLPLLNELWISEIDVLRLASEAGQVREQELKNIYQAIVSEKRKLVEVARKEFDLNISQPVLDRDDQAVLKQHESDIKTALEAFEKTKSAIKARVNVLEQRLVVARDIISLAKEEADALKRKDRQASEIFGLRRQIQQTLLARVEKEDIALLDENIQNILKGFVIAASETNVDKRMAAIDAARAQLLALAPVYKETFKDVLGLYIKEKGFKDTLRLKDVASVQPVTLSSEPGNKALLGQQKLAKEVVISIINNIGVTVAEPTNNDLMNFNTFTQWLNENVFIGILAKSDLYQATLSVLSAVYRPMRPDEQLNTDTHYGLPEPLKFSEKDINMPALSGRNKESSLTNLKIEAGRDSNGFKGSINFGGVVSDIINDVENIGSDKLPITYQDVQQIIRAEKLRSAVGKDVLNRHGLLLRVIIAMRDLENMSALKSTQPLVYDVAYRAYAAAQNAYAGQFGYYVDKSMTDQYFKGLIAADLGNGRQAMLEALKNHAGKYSLTERDLGWLSNIFFNVGLTYENNELSVGFVLALTFFDKQKKLDNVIQSIVGKQPNLLVAQETAKFEKRSEDFGEKFKDARLDIAKRYEALYKHITYAEKVKNLRAFSPENILHLLDSPKGQPTAEGKVINTAVLEVPVTHFDTEGADRAIAAFGAQEEPANEPLGVSKDMPVSEIIKISYQNKEWLEADRFENFVTTDAKAAFVNNALKMQEPDVWNAATFLAENSIVPVAEITEFVKSRLGKKAIGVEERIFEARLRYLRTESTKALIEKGRKTYEARKLKEQVPAQIETRLNALDKELEYVRSGLKEIKQAQLNDLTGTKKLAEDAPGVKMARNQLKSLERNLTSKEKYVQALTKATEAYDIEWNNWFGPDQRFNKDMADLGNEKLPSAYRVGKEAGLIGGLENLGIYSVMTLAEGGQIKNDQGIMTSDNWIAHKLDEIQVIGRETERKRLELKNAYYKKANELRFGLVAGALPQDDNTTPRENSKTSNSEAAIVRMQDLQQLFKANQIYMEESETQAERILLQSLSDIVTKGSIMEWRSIIGNLPPPDAAASYLNNLHDVQQSEALVSLLQEVRPSLNDGLKISLVNLAFVMLRYSRSAEESDIYKDYLTKYFQALVIYSGDIFDVADKLKLSSEDRDLLGSVRRTVEARGIVYPSHNLAQIEGAIEEAYVRADIKALEQLVILRNNYAKALNGALIEAKWDYLNFQKSHPKSINLGIASDAMVTGIMLISNLVSYLLPERGQNKEIDNAAVAVLKDLEKISKTGIGEKAPVVRTDEYLTDQGVIIRVMRAKDGKRQYAYMTPKEFSVYEALRQNRIYQDDNFSLSQTSAQIPAFSDTLDWNREQSFAGRMFYRLDAGNIAGGAVTVDLIHELWMKSKAFEDSFDLKSPEEQQFTFNIGRQGQTSTQNIQVTYNHTSENILGNGVPKDSVTIAFTNTTSGGTSLTVLLTEDGGIGFAGRKPYKLADGQGYVSLAANETGANFFWNHATKTWEIRSSATDSYDGGRLHINFEALRHSSVGDMTGGVFVTYEDGAITPGLKLQDRGLLGGIQTNIEVGYNIDEQQVVGRLSLQNINGMITPHLAVIPRSGALDTTGGVKIDTADYYVDLSGSFDFGANSSNNGSVNTKVGNGAYELGADSRENLNFTWNPLKSFGKTQVAESKTPLIQPVGAILLDKRFEPFAKDLATGLANYEVSGWTELNGMWTDDVAPELTKALAEFGITEKRDIIAFIAHRDAFDRANAARPADQRIVSNFTEVVKDMAVARSLKTPLQYTVADYLLSRRQAPMDIRKPIDFWTLAYVVALAKIDGLEAAGRHLDNAIRIKRDVASMLGGSVDMTDMGSLEVLEHYASKEPAEARRVFEGINKGNLLPAIQSVIKAADTTVSGVELANRTIEWLRRLNDNAFGPSGDLQIFKNTVFFMKKGLLQDEAFKEATEIHSLISNYTTKEYTTVNLERFLGVREAAEGLNIGDSQLWALASQMAQDINKDMLRPAIANTAAYAAEPYYKYLAHEEYAASFKGISRAELMPYVAKVERIAKAAGVVMDHTTSRDFRQMLYWAQVLKIVDNQGAYAERLEAIFRSQTNFYRQLNNDEVLLKHFLGKEKLVDVRKLAGKQGEVFNKALSKVNAFGSNAEVSDLLDSRGYEIKTHPTLIRQVSNGGKVKSIFIPYYGYLSGSDADNLARALIHETVANKTGDHAFAVRMEREYDAWLSGRAIDTVGIKGYLDQTRMAGLVDIHQAGDAILPSDLPPDAAILLSDYQTSGLRNEMGTKILPTYSLNFEDGIDATELDIINSTGFGIIYDTQGQPRDLTQLVPFWERAITYYDNILGLLHAQEINSAILSTLSVNILDNTYDDNDLKAFGYPEFRVLPDIISFYSSWLDSPKKQEINDLILIPNFGIDLMDGRVSANEFNAFTRSDFGIIYDVTGQGRNMAAAVNSYAMAVAFKEQLLASNLAAPITGRILYPNFGLDLTDGNISINDLRAFGDARFGVLYDEQGQQRNIFKAIAFYERVITFENTLLASPKSNDINTLLSRLFNLDLSDGNISIADLQAFGDPDFGILYDIQGQPRNTVLTIKTLEAVTALATFSASAKSMLHEICGVNVDKITTADELKNIIDNILFQKDINDIDPDREFW